MLRAKKNWTHLSVCSLPHKSYAKTLHMRYIENSMRDRMNVGPFANSAEKLVKSTKNWRYRGVSEADSACSRRNRKMVRRSFNSSSSKTSVAYLKQLQREFMKWENKEEFRYGGENEVTSIMIKVRKKISATNFGHFPSHFRADDGVTKRRRRRALPDERKGDAL